ncbi:MAG: TIM barrel protein [Terriglobia bacterium]
MKRRDFISRAAELWLGTGLMDGVAAFAQRQPAYYDARKLYRIGVSSNSFRNYFTATRSKGFDLPGPPLALLDFPQMIADRYEAHNLEFASAHFASTGAPYLMELRRQISRRRSRLISIQVDEPELSSGGGLSDRNPSARAAAVNAAKRWIDVARRLIARSVCIGPGEINPADLTPTVSAYRQLVAYARPWGIHVLIENQQALEPDEMLAVFRSVGGTSIGSLPDFGGFASEAARLAGLRMLFPRATILCHAVGITFDDIGNERAFDFHRCIEISKQLRFRGIYSVDYRGAGDPYQGVQSVINELIRDL